MIMARPKLSTRIRNYVKDVKELQKMRTLRSTRLGDIDKKYDSLVKRHDVITDLAINKWLDGQMTSKDFSPFITCAEKADYGDSCLEFVENNLEYDDGEDWLLGNK
jgi:hypothetical protein